MYINELFNKTVLIADDNITILQLTSEMFTNMGAQVVSCTNGMEVISYTRLNPNDVDLFFIDLNIPLLNAFDCFHRLTQNHQPRPFIVTSGHNDHPLIPKVKQSKINAILHKPYDLNTLAKTVRIVLNTFTENPSSQTLVA